MRLVISQSQSQIQYGEDLLIFLRIHPTMGAVHAHETEFEYECYDRSSISNSGLGISVSKSKSISRSFPTI
jgi:hypothetical protein